MSCHRGYVVENGGAGGDVITVVVVVAAAVVVIVVVITILEELGLIVRTHCTVHILRGDQRYLGGVIYILYRTLS